MESTSNHELIEVRSLFTTVNTFFYGVLMNEQQGDDTQIRARIRQLSVIESRIQFGIQKLQDHNAQPPAEDHTPAPSSGDPTPQPTNSTNYDPGTSELAQLLKRHRDHKKASDSFVIGMYQVVVILLVLCCLVHIVYLHFQLTHLPWNLP